MPKLSPRRLYSQFSGYERIAVAVLSALACDAPRIIPLTVRNDGAIADLEPGDSVELPCRISAAEVTPARVGHVPNTVVDLLVRVKEYEGLVARAALTHCRDAALAALAKNPLVHDEQVARQLLDAYLHAFGDQLAV